jgi:hypothetical protein
MLARAYVRDLTSGEFGVKDSKWKGYSNFQTFTKKSGKRPAGGCCSEMVSGGKSCNHGAREIRAGL